MLDRDFETHIHHPRGTLGRAIKARHAAPCHASEVLAWRLFCGFSVFSNPEALKSCYNLNRKLSLSLSTVLYMV